MSEHQCIMTTEGSEKLAEAIANKVTTRLRHEFLVSQEQKRDIEDVKKVLLFVRFRNTPISLKLAVIVIFILLVFAV